MEIHRTNSSHPEFQRLVNLLDREILKRDGKDFEFYNQFNSSENINEVVLIIEDDKALGCGTFKKYEGQVAEIKRMFTEPEARGKGIATLILNELNVWTKECGYQSLILETGKKYPEAISLYKKYGFTQTENYGPYVGVDDSVCFRKELD